MHLNQGKGQEGGCISLITPASIRVDKVYFTQLVTRINHLKIATVINRIPQMTRTPNTFLGITEKNEGKGERFWDETCLKRNAGVVTAGLLVFLSCHPESVHSLLRLFFCFVLGRLHQHLCTYSYVLPRRLPLLTMVPLLSVAHPLILEHAFSLCVSSAFYFKRLQEIISL